MGKCLAQLAYEEYGDEMGWINYAGKPMPSWDNLPDKQKNGWIRATAKIVALVL